MIEMTKEQVDEAIKNMQEFTKFCEDKFELFHKQIRTESRFVINNRNDWSFKEIDSSSVEFHGWSTWDGTTDEWYDDMPIEFLYDSEELIAKHKEAVRIAEEQRIEHCRLDAEKLAAEREIQRRKIYEGLKKIYDP
jgi:hypothetical protein